jgi:hypothetical protein
MQRNAAQCSAMQRNAAQCSAMQRNAAQQIAAQCHELKDRYMQRDKMKCTKTLTLTPTLHPNRIPTQVETLLKDTFTGLSDELAGTYYPLGELTEEQVTLTQTRTQILTQTLNAALTLIPNSSLP